MSEARPKRRLLVFAKAPIAGFAKTRMIPLLGAEGAAELHRKLAEYTLAQTVPLIQDDALDVEIQFAGGSELEFCQLFPGPFRYRQQVDGDLGQRMCAAFELAFSDGATSVLAIGTDCPDIDGSLIREAFDRLRTSEFVFGPASDGGYYAIGMNRLERRLFSNMPWSQPDLMNQTRTLVQENGWSFYELPEKHDIDTPEDLPFWEKHCPHAQRLIAPRNSDSSRQSNCLRKATLSVIIPVKDDDEQLEQTLLQLKAKSDDRTECIVVEGGDSSQSETIAKTYGAHWKKSSAGRGAQMNVGVRNTSGELLVFLHADTQLPDGFDQTIRKRLADESIVMGAFSLAFDNSGQKYRRVANWINGRARWLKLPYGDQCFFLRRKTFESLGEFSEISIMEDFEFVRRAKKKGRVIVDASFVQTSARRWEELGILRTTWINQCVVAGYFLGVSPDRLAKWYRRPHVPNRSIS